MTTKEFGIVWRYICNSFGFREDERVPELAKRWKVRLDGIAAGKNESLNAANAMTVDSRTRKPDYIEPLIARIKLDRERSEPSYHSDSMSTPKWSDEFRAAFGTVNKMIRTGKLSTSWKTSVEYARAVVKLCEASRDDPDKRMDLHKAKDRLSYCEKQLAENGDAEEGGNLFV